MIIHSRSALARFARIAFCWDGPSRPWNPALTKLPRYPQGPLVGKKTPSTAITEEYAKADPIYVQKTMVRRQRHSPCCCSLECATS